MIRVLLVEDFRPYRSFVISLLSQNLKIEVCEAEDGLQATIQAQQLKPDMILMDIGLPKLNGLEAARQLQELVPHSKILFLSGIDDPGIVREALHTGASGYVVKSDAGSELIKAIEAVLCGEQFVSSSAKRRILEDAEGSQTPNGPVQKENLTSLASDLQRKREINRCHEVQFYSNNALLFGRLTYFIGAALIAGNAAIVFATKPHRDTLLRRLMEYGVDVDAAIQQGTFVSLDAAETLSMFMVNDQPDATRFFEGLGKLISSVSKAAKAEHPRVAMFGEGVALLWAEGNPDGAIQLEKLGNDLAKIHKVDIFCAYPFSLQIQTDGDAFRTVCAEHSAVFVG